MPTAFSQAQKQRIVERLIEQGELRFGAQGLKKTSVEELAAAAGISKAAFYLFFPSKEALFMDVVERVEVEFRREILSAVDRPGASPRQRLASVLKEAFSRWKDIPLLQIFNRDDYELVFLKSGPEKIREHIESDHAFIHDLIARCQASGIPIAVQPAEFSSLMYALFFVSLHTEDLGPGRLTAALDTLADLVAAHCLGEIEQPQPAGGASK